VSQAFCQAGCRSRDPDRVVPWRGIMRQDTTLIQREPPPRPIAGSYLLPVATVAMAILIFALDAITDVSFAVGILFVPVVLMAGRFCRARGVVLVALGCGASTILAHFLSPGDPWTALALGNRALGLAALGLTTLLVVRAQSQEVALSEQAHLLDVAHEGIFVRDRNDVITFWNRGAEELYGWTREEAVGKVSHQLLQTVFPAPLAELTGIVLRSGRWEGELVHRKRDGTQVVVASRWSLQQDDAGRAVGTLETNNDISERKRTDVELQRSEQRFRNIFETTGVSIWEEDFSQVKTAIDAIKAEGVGDFRSYLAEHPEFVQQALAIVKVVDVNDATVKLFGARTKAELLGSLDRIFLPETQEVFAGELIAIAAGQSSFESETVLRTLNGGKLDVLFTMTFPLETGKFDSVLVSLVDITARKQAQEALQRAQAELAHVSRLTTLGELAASIAHEVSQPLAAAAANAEAGLRWLAVQPPHLEEVRQALSHIVKNGHRAGEIIKRLRALVKKTPPQRERLDINDVVREVIALTRSEVQKRGIILQTRLAADLPQVLGDRVQLQQVILNLIVNAAEAMSGEGDGRLELLIDSGGDLSSEVLIAVRDSGPGLKEEGLDHLFDAFYTTKPNGMGMGLAISRSIIASHGGRLWASRNLPHGATFQFTLPTHRETRP
jgi:PAS domain S-box-containing protein